jgi:hypothetical protein
MTCIKFSPGFCCIPAGCLEKEDDFVRANSGTIGNNWTEVLGTWDIVSNGAQTTSSEAFLGDSTILTSQGRTSWTVDLPAGAKMRLGIGYSSGNFFNLDGIIFESSKVSIYAGSTLQGEISASIGTGTRIRIENQSTGYGVLPGDTRASADDAVIVFIDDVAVCNLYGIAFADANLWVKDNSGTFRLTYYQDLKEVSSGSRCFDPAIECIWFPMYEAPDEVNIVISDLVADANHDYSVVNGSYTLPKELYVPGGSPQNRVRYRLTGIGLTVPKTGAPSDGTLNNLTVEFSVDASPLVSCRATLVADFSAGVIDLTFIGITRPTATTNGHDDNVAGETFHMFRSTGKAVMTY